jgi:hypothetical protein
MVTEMSDRLAPETQTLSLGSPDTLNYGKMALLLTTIRITFHNFVF